MYKKHSVSILAFLFLISLSFLTTSCSKKLGYGVVNWSMPEYNLHAGDVIPIYVKSNIEKMYIVGLNEKTQVRVTIPLWQLSFFESKKEAYKFQASMEKERYKYATVKLDGLPMRKGPENTAQQVYRLKESQKVKILWVAKNGVPVLRAGKPLDGAWYEVLTEDGVRGWCFSYNLDMYDEREDLSLADNNNEEKNDEAITAVLNEFWYPENYRRMINNRKIDLDKVSLTWGFFPGARSGIARVEMEEIKESFPYDGITKMRDKYSFNGTSLSLQIRAEDVITVEFSDKDGKRHVENFVTLNASPEDIINNEVARRNKKIERIANTASEFTSENFGKLKILSDGQFIWTGYKLISPAIIPNNAGSNGKVYIKHFISKKVKTKYDGVLNFKFEKAKKPIVFMYEISSQGLRLEAVESSNIKDNLVKRQSLSPVILFFAAN